MSCHDVVVPDDVGDWDWLQWLEEDDWEWLEENETNAGENSVR